MLKINMKKMEVDIMSCRRCSKVFENKLVQCFDEQQISMYMRRSGSVQLKYGEITENTNFNYCPYCGEKLGDDKDGKASTKKQIQK